MNSNGTDEIIPDIPAIASRQWDDYQKRTPGTYFGEDHDPLSVDDAYAVQIELAKLRCRAGDTVAGYKVGCISPSVIEQFGMRGPVFGHIFQGEIFEAKDPPLHGDFHNLAIEGEMAVRLGPHGEITEAFPVIELHHFCFRAEPLSLTELVANNALNAGLVMPPIEASVALSGWSEKQTMTITIDGKIIDTGGLWGMSGGAVEAVDWLRKSMHARGLSLAPGSIVLTATPLGLHTVERGQTVGVSVDGRELIKCQFK